MSPRIVPVASSPAGRESPGPFCLWKEQQSWISNDHAVPAGPATGRMVRVAALLSIAASMAAVVMKVMAV